MEVTEEGMLTEARAVQPLKALPAMLVTEEGMLTEAREEPEKACCPMEVTEEGRLTEDTPLQPWKFRVPPDMMG